MNIPIEIKEIVLDYLVGTTDFHKNYFSRNVLPLIVQPIMCPFLYDLECYCFYCGGSNTYRTNFCNCEASMY